MDQPNNSMSTPWERRKEEARLAVSRCTGWSSASGKGPGGVPKPIHERLTEGARALAALRSETESIAIGEATGWALLESLRNQSEALEPFLAIAEQYLGLRADVASGQHPRSYTGNHDHVSASLRRAHSIISAFASLTAYSVKHQAQARLTFADLLRDIAGREILPPVQEDFSFPGLEDLSHALSDTSTATSSPHLSAPNEETPTS
jgi:hypothetical protein